MLRSFISSDIYRVMLGSARPDTLSQMLSEHPLQPEGEMRRMCRDDGSGVYVAVVLIDGAALEHLSLRQTLMLMQVDNISARLRAAPSLPGSFSGRVPHHTFSRVDQGLDPRVLSGMP